MTAVTASFVDEPRSKWEHDHPVILHIGDTGRQTIRMSIPEAVTLFGQLDSVIGYSAFTGACNYTGAN